MENERSVDRLSRYIITLGSVAIVAGLCWYFRSVLVYVIGAFVLSLLGRPLMKLLRKLKIKGKSAPNWLLAIISLAVIFLILGEIITQALPIVSGIISDAAIFSHYQDIDTSSITVVNEWLIRTFPSLGADFDLFSAIVGELNDTVSVSSITGLIGGLASVASSLLIGLFSIVFISFFFIKDENLFKKLVSAIVPDKIESSVSKTIDEISTLLSRYFVGLTIEMIGVALLDFLGLHLIARLNFSHAIGIAFIAGVLNIIPYVGPLAGEIIGVVLAMILKLGTGTGLAVNIWVFALIVFLVMLATQLVDNFIYQPLIYSTSIKAHPLEIFIVILMAGVIGGVLGVLVAIPAYTVIRVIAFRFFRNYKIIQRLLPEMDEEDKMLNYLNQWDL